MRKLIVIILCVVVICAVAFAQFSPSKVDQKSFIVSELSRMVALDQSLRSQLDPSNLNALLVAKIHATNKEHTDILKRMLESLNPQWITISAFGKEADHNAWLLVQHVDHDVEFQKEILSRLERLYLLGETNSEHVAYLFDRIAHHENRPQKYGTQGDIVDGEWVPYSIENSEDLDFRRASVGLIPFEEYKKQINVAFGLKEK